MQIDSYDYLVDLYNTMDYTELIDAINQINDSYGFCLSDKMIRIKSVINSILLTKEIK